MIYVFPIWCNVYFETGFTAINTIQKDSSHITMLLCLLLKHGRLTTYGLKQLKLIKNSVNSRNKPIEEYYNWII